MRIVSAIAVAGLAGCLAGSGPSDPLPAGGRTVLFVGNSLTYVNDLPATVAAIAASAGDTLRVRMAAGPNLALIDHLGGATDAVAQLRGHRWDWVILQQGPTPSGICRDSLILWTTMFDREIRAAGAEPVVLMTWPSVARGDLFDQVRISFEEAARAVGGIFAPAGEAWRAAGGAAAPAPLYGPDGFHPAPAGTFLTALTIYQRLSGRDPRTLPAQAFADGRLLDLPAATIRLLQAAAATANEHFPARPTPRPSGPVTSTAASTC